MFLTTRIREVATFAATKLVQIFGSIEFANPSKTDFVQTLAGTLEPPPQTPKVGRGRRQIDGVVGLEIILWWPSGKDADPGRVEFAAQHGETNFGIDDATANSRPSDPEISEL